jgi:hypothetical protein
MLILCPFLLLYFTRDVPVCLGGKKYNGIGEYLLLIDTDLKFVVGIFLLSQLINLYVIPLPGLFNYTNLTAILAFLLSIPFCRKMRKLEERAEKSDNKKPAE